ncbi:tail fiber domain-containing protein [Methylobacterium sp. 22177]|uniref:tail fiber domain-containing protein n=1 Tax=Methylobacterium sp. 22177 TaxID=3453885 RepID=UPI003F84472F
MGVWNWSLSAARNALSDALIQAIDGASARNLPGLVRSVMAAMRAYADDQGGGIVTTGTANAYVAATSSGVSELRPGMSLLLRLDRTNTGAASLNVDGSGPKPWRDIAGKEFDPGDLVAGTTVSVVYDETTDAWLATGWVIGGNATKLRITLPGGASQPLTSAIAPVVALGIARADIPSRIIPINSFRVSGFAVAGDYGVGATYIRGTSAGPMAIQDAAGTWFQLDLGKPAMQAGWFGVVPNVLTVIQATANRIGLNVAKAYLTTGRTLYLPTGKIALAPDPANVNAPAWELGNGTDTSVSTVAGFSVLPAGGCSTPGGGEVGGPGGTEFVAVGSWGTGQVFRLNGPITGVDVRLSVNCMGIAATGVDVIHAFRSNLEFEVQRYTANGAVLRTINGPTFNGLTQGFMECTGRITTTLPATRTAEGTVLRAYEAVVAKNAPGYFYQGFSRNNFRIKSEIPGAAGCAAVVIDRIDNNLLPMMFTYAGGNGADAGSGGVRGIASQDGFFPCENTFFAGHILGGWIGNWGTGGNRAPAYSTSDGETLPPPSFVWDTHTGLFGGIRRMYADDSGSVGAPSYTFGSAQNSGLFLVPGSGGAVGLTAGGVLGVHADTAGRVGLGMAPVAGYGAAIAGDVALAGGSRTIMATSGSFLQLQGPNTVYLSTGGTQRVTVDSTGLSVAAAGTFGGGLTAGGDLNLGGGSRTIAATAGVFLQVQAPTTVFLTTAGVQRVTVDSTGLTVAAGGSFGTTLNVTGKGTFGNDLVVTGTGTFGAVTTAGAASLGSLSVTGNGTVGGTFSATGAASFGSTLTVTGKATLNNDLALSGVLTVGGTLTSTGKGTFNGGLAVTGTATLNSGLTVVGASSLSGDISLDGGSRTIAASSGAFLQLQAPTTVYLTTAGAQQVAVDSTGISPAATNTRDLGKSASLQWRNLYLQNAVTVNSDAKLKDEIEAIPDSVLRAVRAVPMRRYKLKQSIEEKGADKARWHVGVIAQDIAAAFEAEGEDAFAWSVLCRTPDAVMVPVAVDDPEADGGRRVEIEERPVLDADGRQTSTLSVRYDEWQNLVLAARLAA